MGVSKTEYSKTDGFPINCLNLIQILLFFENFHKLYGVVWGLTFSSVGKEKHRDLTLSVEMIEFDVFKIDHFWSPTFFSCLLSKCLSHFSSSTCLRSMEYLYMSMALFLYFIDNYYRLWLCLLFSFLKGNYKQSQKDKRS